MTASDITNGFIDIANIGSTGPNDSPQVSPGSSIVSVYKVFQFDESGAGTNMFSVNYQLALNDVYGIRAPGNMSDYYITQSYIQMLSTCCHLKRLFDLVGLQTEFTLMPIWMTYYAGIFSN